MAVKIQNGRHEIQFFDISTSVGGDFPRIIKIALSSFILYSNMHFILFEFEKLNQKDKKMLFMTSSKNWMSYILIKMKGSEDLLNQNITISS